LLLQQFHAERDAQQKLLASLETDKNAPGGEASEGDGGPLDMSAFAEDWNASQFWYTNETADILAAALTHGSPETMNVAVVSAPSVFAGLKRLIASSPKPHIESMKILEFDNRFAAWPEFTHYDYTAPLKLPPEMKGKFDRIILDPPFLSDDCQTKAALTIRWLANTWNASSEGISGIKVMVCTGERMADLIDKLYGKIGVKMTDFEIKHAKGLGNEFRCYANFEQEGVWKFVTSI
jgi:hypothetical protein